MGNHDTRIAFKKKLDAKILVSFLSIIAKMYRYHRRTRSIYTDLGLIHNKVAYILAIRELIHLGCTTYARVLGIIKKNLAKPSHRFAYLCLANVQIFSMQNLIKIYHAVQEL